MGEWRRRHVSQSQEQQKEKKKDGDRWGPPGKSSRRNYGRPPRVPDGKWALQQVPKWERNFLKENRVSWRKIIETQKVMHLYKNVANWDDSGAVESFKYAKSRHETKVVYGFELPLPNPDLYIDSVDHDSILDPKLLEDLYNDEFTGSDKEEGSSHSQESGFCWDSFNVNLDDIIPTGWDDNDEPIDKSNDIPRFVTTGWHNNDPFDYSDDIPGVNPSGSGGIKEAANGGWDKNWNNVVKGGNKSVNEKSFGDNWNDGNNQVIVPDSFWDKWVNQYNQPSVPDSFWDYWEDGNNKQTKQYNSFAYSQSHENKCGDKKDDSFFDNWGDGNKQWRRNWRDGRNQLNAKDNSFRNRWGYRNNRCTKDYSFQNGNTYHRTNYGNNLVH